MDGLAKLRQRFSWPFFLAVVSLMLIGVLNLHSATFSTSLNLLRQQIVFWAIGSIVFAITAILDYRIFYRLAYPLYGLGLLGLLAVLFFGKSVNQSQRWLEIGGINLGQPSEFIKVLLIVALAKYLHDDPVVEGRSPKHMIMPIMLVLIPMFLVIRQPDLGTAMLIFLLFLSIMVLTKLKFRTVFVMSVFATALLPVAWNYLLRDYQRQRVLTFLSPQADPSGAGWQSRQSVIAVGSGGWFGQGYLRGTQNRLNFLPERWTDFPFAVWAEEWGFAGSLVLLSIYFCLVLWAVHLASQARDRFGAVLCVGIAALIFWHTVVNIGMVTGIVPVVGVTLPFVSYGGSSLLTMLCAAGLLMNVAIRRTSF